MSVRMTRQPKQRAGVLRPRACWCTSCHCCHCPHWSSRCCTCSQVVLRSHFVRELLYRAIFYLQDPRWVEKDSNPKLKNGSQRTWSVRHGMEWNGISWRSQGYDQADWVKKKPFNAAWTSECSKRALRSHPLAGQAQACGSSTQVDGPGPDGTCRGHWLISLLKKRLHFSIRACHPCACPCYSALYHSSDKLLELCSSSLRRAFLSSARADVEIF